MKIKQPFAASKTFWLYLNKTEFRQLLAQALMVITCLSVAFTPAHSSNQTIKPLKFNQEIEAVNSLNALGLPAQVSAVNLLKNHSAQRLNLSINNITNERVTKVELKLFIFDSSRELKSIESFSEPMLLDAKSNRQTSILLLKEIEEQEQLAVAIQRVNVNGGVWEADLHQLKDAIKVKAEGKPFQIPIAHYEENLIITDMEKAGLITSSLQRIMSDRSLRETLSIKDRSNILLSLKNIIDYSSMKIPNTNLTLIKPSDIQNKADQEGEISYFEIEQMKVEGARVNLVISHKVKARLNNVFTPCCGSVAIYYRKIFGKWKLIEMKSHGL